MRKYIAIFLAVSLAGCIVIVKLHDHPPKPIATESAPKK